MCLAVQQMLMQVNLSRMTASQMVIPWLQNLMTNFLFLRSVALLTLKRQSNTSRHLLTLLLYEVRMVVFLIFFFFFFLLAIMLFCREGQRDREGRQVVV